MLYYGILRTKMIFSWILDPYWQNAGHFCNLKAPSKVKKFSVPKYGNIHSKRCVLKNVSKEKKPYLKILSVAWDMAKKLPKKTLFGQITVFSIFCLFFGHFSGPHLISSDETFFPGSHFSICIFWCKYCHTPRQQNFGP